MKHTVQSSVTRKLFPLLVGASTLFIAVLQAGAIIDSSLQMQLGNPSGATADATNHDHYLIQRTVEALDYSDNLGEPNWASWDLTTADEGTNGRGSYHTDTTLPSGFYAVTSGDYNNSGYDRGHMCPSADRTDNQTDNDLVFLMSNLLPQQDDLNTGPWEALETYSRTLASAGNELLITSGPSNFDGSRIPSGKAAIPGYTWKIVVVVPGGSGSAISRITSTTRVVTVKMPNVAGIHSVNWTNYITCVNRIQADTGYTFFTALSSSIASALRAQVDGGVDHYPSAGKVVISQVYGGGGNSGATYKNDFIELYNSGSAAVDLSTYAVQYTSATGSNWTETTLSGTIQPGHYYLIQEAQGSGGTQNLPTPDATGTISMAATAGKVALTSTTTLLSGSNPVGRATVVDFVGYGTTANAYEGSGPAPAPSATTSDLRANGGATDTDNNAADFATGAVNPRNSSSGGSSAPSITSFSPTSGPIGTNVVITGANFTGATSVAFNGTSATFTVNSDTQITATVPTGATTGTISVTGPGGTGTSSGSFTVAPSITSFSPTSGPIGTNVVITGANFTGATSVAFHGTSATFTVNSDTQITATVPTGATTGTISVTTPGGTGTSSSSFTVAIGIVVISQVYGGGGNSGATYKNDFIELYNRGNATVDLSNYAVQYATATGSSWSETTLSGSIAAGHYYLVQEAQGSGGTQNLPTPEATGTINLAATAGKVALTKTQTLLTVSNPVGSADVVDFIGYGTTANAYEGSGPAPAPSNTTADLRANGGATDTDNNASDFATGSPNPRN